MHESSRFRARCFYVIEKCNEETPLEQVENKRDSLY
jgi:hypothetical protein